MSSPVVQTSHSPCNSLRTHATNALEWCKNSVEKYKEPTKQLIFKTAKIAGPILYMLTGIFFFLSSTNFFIFGMTAAVISPKFMTDCIQRIQSVFTKIALFAWLPLSLGAVFAGPLLLGISSFFIGGHVCLQVLPKQTNNNSISP